MTPVAKAGTAGTILAASPLLPLADLVSAVVYAVAAVLLVLTIVDACRDSWQAGYAAGERAHRFTHLAEVIRLPVRRKDTA